MPDITKKDYQSWKKRKAQREVFAAREAEKKRSQYTPLVNKPSAQKNTTTVPGVTDPGTGYSYTPIMGNKKIAEDAGNRGIAARVLQEHIADTSNRRMNHAGYKRGDLGSINADKQNNLAFLDTVRTLREHYAKDKEFQSYLDEVEKYAVEYDRELQNAHDKNMPFAKMFAEWGEVPEETASGYYAVGGIKDTLNGLYADLRAEHDPEMRRQITEQIGWYERYAASQNSLEQAEQELNNQRGIERAANERYDMAAREVGRITHDIEDIWASPRETLDEAANRVFEATNDSNYYSYNDIMSAAGRDAAEAKAAAQSAESDIWSLQMDAEYGFSETEAEIAEMGGMTDEQLEQFKLDAANDNSLNRLANREVNARYGYNGVEAATYQYYLVNYGQEAANAYASFVRDRVERRVNEEAAQMYYEMGDYSDAETGIGKVAQAAGATLASVAANISQAIHTVDIIGQNIQRAATGSNEPVHYYSTSQLSEASGQPRQAVADNLAELGNLNELIGTEVPVIGEMGFDNFYNAGVDGVNAIVNRGLWGHFQGVMMGVQAAAPAFDEAHERGASDQESLFFGMATGANEMIGETLGYESFLKVGIEHGLFNGTLGKVVLGMLLQPVNEGVEEGITERLNQWSDKYFLGANSKYNGLVKAYESMGYTYEEAMGFANEQLGEEALQAAIQGIIGGYISTGGYYAGVAIDKATAASNERALRRELAAVEAYFATESDKQGAAPEEVTTAAPEGTSAATKARADKRLAAMKTTEGEASLVDNAPVTVAGITKTGADATVTVTDESGADRQVKLEEVTVGKGTQGEVYAYAADMATPELANTFRMVYRPDQDISQVANGMEYVYEMAEGGAPETFLRKSSLISALNDDQFQHAYELGKKRRVETIKAADEKATARLQSVLGNQWKGGTLSMGDVVEASLTEKQREDVELVRVLAGISGYNVELFQSTANEAGRFTRENGSFNRATNTISLDVNAGRDYIGDSMAKTALLRTMSHEVTHAIKANSPAIYGRLQEAVLEVLSTQGIDIDERISAVMTRDSSVKSRADALEEIVSDACETMLGDSDVAQRFKEVHPEAARSLGEKILEFLKNLRDAIKKAFAGEAGAKSVEAKALLKDMDAFQKIAEIWTEGALQTSEVVGRENGSAMQQETETTVTETVEETVGQFDEPAQPAEAHIDQRDWENVADNNVRAFQNDYKFARNWMGLAARVLRYDVDATIPGMRFMNAEGEWNGQKRQTTDLLAYLKDEGKWTWDQIGAALDKIASYYENGDIESDMPNSRRIKRIELVLDDMLSTGYTTMDGIEIAPDRGWLEYKKELPGAEAQAIPENAVYGAYEVRYQARVGYTEDGIAVYTSNFPEGTTRPERQARILQLVQDVWSKNPIKLKILRNGREETITAKFDPYVDPAGRTNSDATKLAFGNRKGSSPDQRTTEKLADDFPEIISNSEYSHTTQESGKETVAHSGVLVWHYFANRIGFINEKKNYAEYNVTVDVKEKEDGDYVYAFAAVKIKGSERPKAPTLYSAPGTINAPVRGISPANAINSIPQPASDFNPEIKNSTRRKPDPDTEELLRIHNEYREAQNDLAESKRSLPVAQDVVDDFVEQYNERTVNYDDVKYSARVTDEDTLDFLDDQDTVTTYKTMQLVDGKLYPPMAAVVAGKYEDYSVLGTWEQATEHPELIKLDKKGKPQFNLNKGQGKGNVPAAYNPYMHSSNLVLNDQFSSAYNRPNLVTVECEVPVSELTSGYKAQYAKDAVGWHSWHTGTVAGALRKATGMERQVLLSRWIKPVRIVPDAEVAQMYKDLLDGTGVEVPDNVVPPNLLNELKKAGVPIKKSGKVPGEMKFSRRLIDRESEARYNKTGWTTENGVLSYNELRRFESMLNTQVHGGKMDRHKTKDGLWAIAAYDDNDVQNIVVVTDGKPLGQNIHRVYRIYSEYDTYAEEVRDAIYAAESTYGKNAPRNAQKYFETGNIGFFEREDFDYYGSDGRYLGGERGRGGTLGGTSEGLPERSGRKETSGQDGSVRLSTRDPYEVSDREILANALESAAKDSTEKAWLQGYKNDLADMNAMQQVLDENRAVVRELMFKKGRTAEESDRLKKAQERVKALAGQLARKDKALIKIEAAAPIRAILDREGKKVREKMRAKQREDIAAIRQTQENAAVRKRIARKVKRLDELLRNPTDQKHVPDNLKAATLDMLKVFTDDTSVFDKEKLERVRREYAELTNRDADTSAAGLYDEDTAERIALLSDTIGEKRLSQLTREQLDEVTKVIDHFVHLIKDANAVFVEGRRERVDALAMDVAEATQKRGIHMDNRANMNALWKLLSQGQITPAYFFRRLGGTMGRLGNAILNGENRFGVNAMKSRNVMTSIMKQYNHKKWAGDKKDVLSFVTEAGEAITVTREQALSLYATDKRERGNRLQNASHLRTGGIVIQQGKLGLRENRASNANATPISTADMDKINSWLTAEQKAYADAMVEYISKDMAELGNETSRALHGYSKFGEGYYFPYKTSSDFRKTNLGDSETALLKSMGFTKSVVRNANTPIIVGDFTETVSEHVAKMLMYNSFAEAQDAFMRVYDYKLTKSRSVKSAIKTAWGKNITDYIEQFMRDVYGGITRDQSDTFGDWFLSTFKKNAVLASASVAIQQPSALMRAMAYIDPKYFGGNPLKGGYKEAMQYAGTAVIKDIGRFDTNTGRSVAEWMVAEDYQGISEKTKALFTDADYRSDILGAGPEKMDQIAWGMMWNAAKREQAAETGLDINSEELKEIAGRRFDEVMRYTQVYDSVMSRSQVMRSKTTYAKMLTAFMAEPTVTYNMFVDAWFDKQTGGEAKAKRVTRTMAALTGSILLNNLLKAIVAAARDDDDENETYRERYIKNFASNLVTDFIPLNYIPYAKDVISIFQGYEVQRSDIGIVKDMFSAIVDTFNEKKSLYEKTKSLSVFLGLATGIPVKNIWRDVEAAYNTFDTVKDQRVLREGWLTHAMEYGAGEIFGKKDTKANSTAKLLKAAISGDSRAIDGLREHMSAYNGMDEKEINSALANAIHEALEGEEIDSAQAQALLMKYAGHDEDEAETKLNKWMYKMDTGNNYSDMKEQFLAGEITEEDAVQARMEYGGVSEEKARKTVSEWQFEKDNDFAYDDMEEAFKNGDITKQQAIEARLDAGADEDDAYWDVTGWEYEKQTGNEWNGRATKLNAAMASGNLTTIEEAITELYDHNTWKNPSSELTGDITAYWKPLYVAATEAERKAMLPLIYDCYELAYTLNGEVYYGDDNVWKKRIKRWESD